MSIFLKYVHKNKIIFQLFLEEEVSETGEKIYIS